MMSTEVRGGRGVCGRATGDSVGLESGPHLHDIICGWPLIMCGVGTGV